MLPKHFLVGNSYILTTLMGPKDPQTHKSQKLNIAKINFSEFNLKAKISTSFMVDKFNYL